MTLKEILALDEERPCPGCPVCQPRFPRRRRRRAAPSGFARRRTTDIGTTEGASSGRV